MTITQMLLLFFVALIAILLVDKRKPEGEPTSFSGTVEDHQWTSEWKDYKEQLNRKAWEEKTYVPRDPAKPFDYNSEKINEFLDREPGKRARATERN